MYHLSWQYKQVGSLMLIGLTWCSFTLANSPEDCQLASEYDSLAQADRGQSDGTTLQHRRRASELCPTYQRLVAVGELATLFGEALVDQQCIPGAQQDCKTGLVVAAEAYIAALPLAASDQATAETIGRYAQVLNDINDPQKANNYISEALKLDPKNLWLQQLAQEISTRMNSQEALRTGLGDFKVPPMILSAMQGTATQTIQPSRSLAPARKENRSTAINVPLNFIVDSTRLDPMSESRLRDVVAVLAEDTNRQYHLIGHADVTGSAKRNQELSEQRAESIYILITTMAPQLRERISFEGQGSSNPIRLGTTDQDHQQNRRVEIFVK